MSIRMTTIYADVVKASRIKTVVILILLGLLGLSISNNTKPPLVIRTMPSGLEVQSNYTHDPSVTQYDIDLFTRHFVTNLNFFDSFRLEEDIPKAMNMMTPALRDFYKKSVITRQFITDIRNRNTNTTTTIKEIQMEMGDTHIPVTAIYERRIIDYDNDHTSTILLRADMIIERLDQRSKRYPYGLLVKQFKEISLNGDLK